MKRLIVVLGLVLCASVAEAATISSPSCSLKDVTDAVGSARPGDTVTIPPGTCAWTAGITLNGVKLQGAGSGRIISYSEPTQTIGSGSKTFTLGSTNGAWTGSGLNLSPGQLLRVSKLAARQNFMEGTVTSYTGNVLVMNVTSTGGSGTGRQWVVSTPCTTCLVNDVAGGVTMFAMNENPSFNTHLAGIKVVAGTGAGFIVRMYRENTGLPMVLSHAWFEITPKTVGAAIFTNTNRGVIHHLSCDSSGVSQGPMCIQQADTLNASASWSSLSTMGMADKTGTNNLYVEDSDFHSFLNAFDNTDNGRMVVRKSVFNHSGFGTHGADSAKYGQRHFEVYDNIFVYNGYSDGTSFNVPRWFLVRGGTFVITGNVFQCCMGTDYGTNRPLLDMTVYNLRFNSGPNPCWTSYPVPRQVGFGRVTGTAGLDRVGVYSGDSEPAYVWNNTGNKLPIGISDFAPNQCPTTNTSSAYIVSGRDYFIDVAKPGYSKFTYPHPLARSTLPPPTGLQVK